MRRIMTVAAVGLLCWAGAAGAQEEAPNPARDVLQGRQAALNLSGVAMGAMKASIDAGQPAEQQAFAARSLARWARALPGMFPAGTGPDDFPGATRAKAEIWSDRAGFEAKAVDYAVAAERLQELARANDAEGFAAQWAVVRQTCQACHDVYRNE